jgi:hypothetical protein
MRDSLTYAPERLESLQPSASEEDQVGRLVRNCEEEDRPVLVLETQRLPDCDRARGRAVDAAEDAVEDLGLARLCVHPRGLGCRSGVDDVLRPEERRDVALESWQRDLHPHLCSIASPWRSVTDGA